MSERSKAIQFNRSTRDALRTVYAALNKGQQKQIIKDPAVKELFDRYKVIPDEEEV